jgi:threonine/homoserine/homoserine lactone efflux protein
MISYLIFGISYAFACVVQPGPFQAFLFSQSIRNGWRKTLPLVLAPLFSDLPVIILVLFILTKIPFAILQVLQCFGGAFLLFLAYQAYITLITYNKSKEKDVVHKFDLLKAIIVNFFNPAPYLGWSLVIGPQLIKGWGENHVNGIILITGFYCSMFIYSAFMVILFAKTATLGPRVSRISTYISILVLLIFGFYQVLSGIKSLI